MGHGAHRGRNPQARSAAHAAGCAVHARKSTEDDLALARALLAERSPEDIAAALARLYRARLPSPEDILDPGQDRCGRSRDDRGRDKHGRTPRDDDRASGPRSKPGKPSPRHVMAEGSVWFRAAIGRQKNAEARWLLPMICRRGGIDKQDIGAIRILDTTTEFEISQRVANPSQLKSSVPTRKITSASRRWQRPRATASRATTASRDLTSGRLSKRKSHRQTIHRETIPRPRGRWRTCRRDPHSEKRRRRTAGADTPDRG